MKRRTFIWIATAATSILAIPVIDYTCKKSRHSDPVVVPDVLARFCDEKTLKDIGKKYLLSVPSEAEKEQLKKLILANDADTRLKSSISSDTSDWINQKIRHDFEANQVFTIDGWILSRTEARQCALFSLVNK
jgi:hypothetical protein